MQQQFHWFSIINCPLGYPGILGYSKQDAQQFAGWDVDYVKLDGCYSLPTEMDIGYPEFGNHLNGTGRAMIYSCSWPVYQIYAGISVSKFSFEFQGHDGHLDSFSAEFLFYYSTL